MSDDRLNRAIEWKSDTQYIVLRDTIKKLSSTPNPADPFDHARTIDLLKISLSTAVPLWAYQLRQQPREYLSRRSGECAEIVACEGDCLMYRTKDRTARAFNALAEGIAILSFCPGGVRLFGLHFENQYE